MYIHNVFMQLRTTEGVIKEKLELTELEWQVAMKKYGPLQASEDDPFKESDEKEMIEIPVQIEISPK